MKAKLARPAERNFILHHLLLPGSSFILVLLLLTGCGVTVTPPPPIVLKAAGSTSMGPLLHELARAYSAERPYVTVDIQEGGSQLGQTLVEAGQVDLGLESGLSSELEERFRRIPIARDAIVLIVHPQNRVAGLSLAEVRSIFSGRLLDWSEAGGLAGSIQVISREEGSGTRAIFEMRVMDGQAVTPTAIVLPNSQAVVEFVAQNSNAIAYVSLAFVSDKVYAVPVEGITPSLESLTAGSYPLTRDLMLITPTQGQPEVNNFVGFILSPAGQAIVIKKWGRVR